MRSRRKILTIMKRLERSEAQFESTKERGVGRPGPQHDRRYRMCTKISGFLSLSNVLRAGTARAPVATSTCSQRGMALQLCFVWVLGLTCMCLVTATSFSAETQVRASVILAIGAPGDDEYATNFLRQAAKWQEASRKGDAHLTMIGLGSCTETNDHDQLRQALSMEPKDGSSELWVVLIGHGTFDGKEARFNLRGPDLTATELAELLKPFQRPVAVINTTECSGPFLNKLSATNRVIITATRSGNEQSFAHFGQYFTDALTDPQADLDHDGQVSLLEAFLTASRQVGEFYSLRGRLASEHALLDDNGDGLGTPADWFRGLRAVKQPKQGQAADGLLAQQFQLIPSLEDRNLSAEQITERNALEKTVLQLRERKSEVPEADYYQQLQALLLQLAKFYGSQLTNSAAADK